MKHSGVLMMECIHSHAQLADFTNSGSRTVSRGRCQPKICLFDSGPCKKSSQASFVLIETGEMLHELDKEPTSARKDHRSELVVQVQKGLRSYN